METIIETIIQLLPTFFIAILALILIYSLLIIKKYLKIKTKYYEFKLKKLKGIDMNSNEQK